jgi:hypothetical protein
MRTWWRVILCVWLACSYAPVRAQDTDPTRAASARAMFEEGVKFADNGAWTDAADRFRRALALRDSQVIRFNLASALVELGKLVEASELLRQVERDESVDGKLRDDARQRLEQTVARIGKLTVHVEGSAAGATILLDERTLAPEQLGVALPTDPGNHHVSAQRDGSELDARDVVLAEGAEQTVSLQLAGAVATPEEAARTVALAPADTQQRDSASDKKHKWLWWGVAGGAVVVAAAVVISVLATSGSGSGTKKSYQGDFDPPSIPVQVSSP